MRANPHVLLSLGRVLSATFHHPKTGLIPLAAETQGLACSPPTLGEKVQKDARPLTPNGQEQLTYVSYLSLPGPGLNVYRY